MNIWTERRLWLCLRATTFLLNVLTPPPARVVCRNLLDGDNVWLKDGFRKATCSWSDGPPIKGWVLESPKIGKLRARLIDNLNADESFIRTELFGHAQVVTCIGEKPIYLVEEHLPSPLADVAMRSFLWAGFFLLLIILRGAFPFAPWLDAAPVLFIFFITVAVTVSLGTVATLVAYLYPFKS